MGAIWSISAIIEKINIILFKGSFIIFFQVFFVLTDRLGRYFANPVAKRLEVDGLDDLIGRALDLAQRDLLAYKLLVVNDRFVPANVEKVENPAHGGLRVQHKLLVVDGHARVGPDRHALGVHVLDDVVPALQTVLVAVQVEAGDGHLARDDRVHGGASVAYHEYEAAVGKDGLHVGRVAEHERVFVAQDLGRLAVAHDHLEYERADGRVDDLVGHAGVLQPLVLLLRVVPLIAHVDEARYDARLLAAPYRRMSVEHGAHERRARARHAAHEHQRHLAIVRIGVLACALRSRRVHVVAQTDVLDVASAAVRRRRAATTARGVQVGLAVVLHEQDDQTQTEQPREQVLELDALDAATKTRHE